jgi:hypothetical protein
MNITYDDSTEIRQTFHFLESSTTSLCDPVFVMMKLEHAGRVKKGASHHATSNLLQTNVPQCGNADIICHVAASAARVHVEKWPCHAG